MQLSVARRIKPRSTGEFAACALLGFGAGLAAGFLFSEVFGTGGHRRMGRLLRRRVARGESPDPARAALLARVRAALLAEPALRAEALEVRPRGRGLELRGWLPTRSARALGYRVARSAAGGIEISNQLLVRGEDDGPSAPPAVRPASA
jgi:hypothetical protein